MLELGLFMKTCILKFYSNSSSLEYCKQYTEDICIKSKFNALWISWRRIQVFFVSCYSN